MGRSHCLDCHSLWSPHWWFPSPYSSASWGSDCAPTLTRMEDTEILANLKTFGCLVLKVNSNRYSFFFFFTKEADYSFYDAVDFLNVLDFLPRIPLFKYDTRRKGKPLTSKHLYYCQVKFPCLWTPISHVIGSLYTNLWHVRSREGLSKATNLWCSKN